MMENRELKRMLCICNSSSSSSLAIKSIFQQYFVYQVQKIRLQGYYSFSQKLKHIVRLPFAITAYGTAAMLLVMVWKPHISILSISTVLRIIMLIEAICAASFMSVYIGCMSSVLLFLTSILVGGFPLVRPMLISKILRLQECLSKYERTDDGSTPQVDLAHLLAARDQELRTLSAEVNQQQSELRLARSLIAERELEVQRVRNTNNQYVEENERLRAILGEWSTRAAKLERALEVERMSNLELQKKISTLRNQSVPAESNE
ncbi:hypothetical protein Patl1_13590 [Pistacia atlantica]|uniref:Uncharacterized protein n=1 Tax=Pistacia atlantica TaxID=434234 RepID=A0ACC1AYI1_9ROSI|nr:hypothetical protein Patl1_13590 [Pistacia atlantica]